MPVTGFATFYVTGWTARQLATRASNGDDPVPDNAGYIVGHFIKYVDTLNTGGGSGELCDFNALRQPASPS